jgi:dehydrogenase/reductase SDR family protein 12
MKRLFNKLLDKSIYYSFDKTGYKRHEKEYFSNYQKTSLGNVLITGGTAGIGQSLSRMIAKNAYVVVTGRNEESFNPFENLEFCKLDSGDWDSISSFAKISKQFDHLVLNAGAMPDTKQVNSYGLESQCASQLIGHLHLFKELHKYEKLKKGAHIVITSSGGMLLKKLDLASLFFNTKYEKVSTYANVKRAQIILIQFLADRYPEYTFSAMHPGWVDTKAVRISLPGFYSFMGERLRTPTQGADTIEFLLNHKVDSGKFWFDRKESPTHFSFLTKESKEDKKKLLNCFENFLAAPSEQLCDVKWPK